MLLVFVLWFSRNSSSGQQGGVFSFVRSRAKQVLGDRPDVTFKDVAGMDEAKLELEEVVDFLRTPKSITVGRADSTRRFAGRPSWHRQDTVGAGRIRRSQGAFFQHQASEFVEMFVGVGASRVRDLFEQVKKVAPASCLSMSWMLLDDGGVLVWAVNDEREQTLNQLLVEMDGFDASHHDIIVLAATNRPDYWTRPYFAPGGLIAR